MEIRETTTEDLPRVMEIYEHARRFMASHGNPNQWGPRNWPPQELIEEDIRTGRSYVCMNDKGRVIGTFFYDSGQDVEPTYRVIENGAWRDEGAYGVVHRIAGDGSEKGIGAFCINWALDQCGHIRIDTHEDNIVMQNLLTKLGFEKRGIIHILEDDYPRLAYEKIV